MRWLRNLAWGVMILWAFGAAVDLEGAWWTKRLTYNPGSSWASDIALYGSSISVVWSDDTPGNYEVYFKKSADGGATWTAAKRLTYSGAWSIAPAIAVNGSAVYVVWGEYDEITQQDEIYFRKSADGGATWKTLKRLTYTTDLNYWPYIGVDLAVNGSNIYVTWHDDAQGNKEIFFRKSADGGASWQTAQRLTYGSGSSEDPAVSVTASNVYLAWHDDVSGDDEIYFRKSVDGGASWKAVKMLTTNSSWSYSAALHVLGSNVYVAWTDGTPGNNEIYFRKSADGGSNWQAAKRLTFTAGDSGSPTLGVDKTIIYLAWHDDTPGNNEVYFRRSGDGGANWQASQRLTFTAGWSGYPSLAYNGAVVCVAYEDNTPGNSEIYLKYSSGSF